MHLVSVARVCGVHCVIPNGKPTAGMVLAFFSDPASLCFWAAVVVEDAVPDNGCTYFTISWLFAIAEHKSNKQYSSFKFKVLSYLIWSVAFEVGLAIKRNSRLKSPEGIITAT